MPFVLNVVLCATLDSLSTPVRLPIPKRTAPFRPGPRLVVGVESSAFHGVFVKPGGVLQLVRGVHCEGVICGAGGAGKIVGASRPILGHI